MAQPDYGPAIWHPICNANWYTSGYGHKFCVVHDMEGYYGTCISMMSACSHTSSSVYYCINGLTDSSDNGAPPGEITQIVRESYYAWHACCWNQYSYGCEHEGFASNPAWYTEAMYQASGGLLHVTGAMLTALPRTATTSSPTAKNPTPTGSPIATPISAAAPPATATPIPASTGIGPVT